MSRIAYDFRPKLLKSIWLIFKRELQLHWHNKIQILESLLFFFISITVAQLTTNQLDSSTIFLIILFSIILSSDSLLYNDFKKGTLEQFLILGINVEAILMAKTLAQILVTAVPLTVIIYIIECFNANDLALNGLAQSTFLLITSITLVCLFANALCISYNRNIFVTILVMPLIIPTIIFASLSLHDDSYIFALYGILCLEIPLFIIASTAVIKEVVST
jgi:heme exporter protein CcmB